MEPALITDDHEHDGSILLVITHSLYILDIPILSSHLEPDENLMPFPVSRHASNTESNHIFKAEVLTLHKFNAGLMHGPLTFHPSQLALASKLHLFCLN